MSWLVVENRTGQAILHGDTSITPISQAWVLRAPGMNGGLIWNRPVSVVVQQAGQAEQVYPVQDVTRIAQITLLAFGLAAGIAIWLMGRRR